MTAAPHFLAKFVKQFAQLRDTIQQAVRTYSSEIRSGTFPDDSHSHH